MKGSEIRLVKLRNPWGYGEWEGTYVQCYCSIQFFVFFTYFIYWFHYLFNCLFDYLFFVILLFTRKGIYHDYTSSNIKWLFFYRIYFWLHLSLFILFCSVLFSFVLLCFIFIFFSFSFHFLFILFYFHFVFFSFSFHFIL